MDGDFLVERVRLYLVKDKIVGLTKLDYIQLIFFDGLYILHLESVFNSCCFDNLDNKANFAGDRFLANTINYVLEIILYIDFFFRGVLLALVELCVSLVREADFIADVLFHSRALLINERFTIRGVVSGGFHKSLGPAVDPHICFSHAFVETDG